MKDACSDEGFSSSGHTVYILYTPPHPPNSSFIHYIRVQRLLWSKNQVGPFSVCMHSFQRDRIGSENGKEASCASYPWELRAWPSNCVIVYPSLPGPLGKPGNQWHEGQSIQSNPTSQLSLCLHRHMSVPLPRVISARDGWEWRRDLQRERSILVAELEKTPEWNNPKREGERERQREAKRDKEREPCTLCIQELDSSCCKSMSRGSFSSHPLQGADIATWKSCARGLDALFQLSVGWEFMHLQGYHPYGGFPSLFLAVKSGLLRCTVSTWSLGRGTKTNMMSRTWQKPRVLGKAFFVFIASGSQNMPLWGWADRVWMYILPIESRKVA